MLAHSFRAMGTEVELFLDAEGDADAALLESVEDEFHRLEAILSRFRPESELSLLNAERSRQVGPELLELVRLSLDARERTSGRFDPTIHDALVAAGYDRTFEDVPDGAPAALAAGPSRCGAEIELDELDGRVTLGPGCRLDLGGIAKGWTADRALALLSHAGPALVNAGGDLACREGPWHVGVETPVGTITLELDQGALATTGRDRRHWIRRGQDAHHVIDPQTGAPAEGALATVTVAAPTAAAAEVLATSLFLAGDPTIAGAEAYLQDVPAVLVALDGTTYLVGGLR